MPIPLLKIADNGLKDKAQSLGPNDYIQTNIALNRTIFLRSVRGELTKLQYCPNSDSCTRSQGNLDGTSNFQNVPQNEITWVIGSDYVGYSLKNAMVNPKQNNSDRTFSQVNSRFFKKQKLTNNFGENYHIKLKDLTLNCRLCKILF